MKLLMQQEMIEDCRDPRDSVEFTLRALKAMQEYCERRLTGDRDPVMYDEKAITGFLLSVMMDGQCMLLGVGAGMRDQIRAAGALLKSIRQVLPESKFYELLMVLYKGTESEEDEEIHVFHKQKGASDD